MIFAAHFIGFASINPQNDEAHIKVVVIDAGHGGKDFGAISGDVREKDIALDLALDVGQKISTQYPDLKVVYTRKTDVFVPLYERAQIANRNKADLFLSIHLNSINNVYAQGTETFVLGQHRSAENLEVAKKENAVILLEDNYETTYEGFDPNSSESYIMFELVQDEYLNQSVMFASAVQMQFRNFAKRVDRSVKQAGFLVLRQATMPSVLIEAGFISHKDERKYLLSEQGKSTLSNSIFLAFQDYKRKIENKSNFEIHSSQAINKVNNENNLQTDISTLNTEHVVEQTTKKENEMVFSKKQLESDIIFSVQIGASKKKVETISSNFKGVKNVYCLKIDDYYKFFTGKFQNIAEAEKEKEKVLKKYPEAFIVAFENNKLISVKKALEKM